MSPETSSTKAPSSRPLSQAKQRRIAALLPKGEPRYARCYDTGPDGSFDRYTAVFTGNSTHTTNGEHWYLGMSERPYHPQGVGQHGGSRQQCDTINGWAPALGRKHPSLGKRIPFTDLPPDCKRAALETYCDLWDLPMPALPKEGEVKP